VLASDGPCVVAEGAFATDRARNEFENELPNSTAARLVLLELALEAALIRMKADASRGLSRSAAFLSAHYDTFSPSGGTAAGSALTRARPRWTEQRTPFRLAHQPAVNAAITIDTPAPATLGAGADILDL
jgi:hypothetical protein